MTYRVQEKYAVFIKHALLVVMVSYPALTILSHPLQAQSSTQVNIVGIPPVISSPYADDIESKFKSGQYQVIFNYSNFSSQPVDFVFDVALTRNNRILFEITSVPRAYTPGSYVFTSFFEEIQFRETSDDILGQLNRDLKTR
ncbi:hypothetical protein [Rhodohalobacter sp. 8-1]|uniref:hypothetical protein n=1 Tax=Rhodohalobacter sp. 8-1 TaxID=3131972 RepID=UPI0030EE4573